jgi:hypothetical protein
MTEDKKQPDFDKKKMGKGKKAAIILSIFAAGIGVIDYFNNDRAYLTNVKDLFSKFNSKNEYIAEIDSLKNVIKSKATENEFLKSKENLESYTDESYAAQNKSNKDYISNKESGIAADATRKQSNLEKKVAGSAIKSKKKSAKNIEISEDVEKLRDSLYKPEKTRGVIDRAASEYNDIIDIILNYLTSVGGSDTTDVIGPHEDPDNYGFSRYVYDFFLKVNEKPPENGEIGKWYEPLKKVLESTYNYEKRKNYTIFDLNEKEYDTEDFKGNDNITVILRLPGL